MRALSWPQLLRVSPMTVGLGLLLAAATFTPRLLPFPRAHVTWDEMQIAVWAEDMRLAACSGRFAETASNAYPAATLLWVELLRNGCSPPAPAVQIGPEEARQRAFVSLPERRFRLGLLDGLLVLATAAAAGALVDRTTGVIVGLLLALDPWLLSQARLFRVEAVSVNLMGLSLFTALLAERRHHRGLAFLSGSVAGAAAVTKVTTLFLAGFVPVLFLAFHLVRSDRTVRDLISQLASWSAALMLTAVALWPALWAAPTASVHLVVSYLMKAATVVPGTVWRLDLGRGVVGAPAPFFLGTIQGRPNIGFYFLFLLYRLSPAVSIGLTVAGWMAFRGLRRAVWSRDLLLRALPLAALVAHPVGYLTLLHLGSVKAGHYAMAVLPPLALLAGVGLRTMAGAEDGPSLRRHAVWLLTGASGLALCLVHHPYYSTFWNPFLGGGRTAIERVPVGQHEGIATLIQDLSQRPEAGRLRLATPWTMGCRAAFPGACVGQEADQLMKADYVITHVFRTQRQPLSRVDRWLPGAVPVMSYERDGVEYATLFRLPSGLHSAAAPWQGADGLPDPERGSVVGFTIQPVAEGEWRVRLIVSTGTRPSTGPWSDARVTLQDSDGRVLAATRLAAPAAFQAILNEKRTVVPLEGVLTAPNEIRVTDAALRADGPWPHFVIVIPGPSYGRTEASP